MARPKSLDENRLLLDGGKLRAVMREQGLLQWWVAEQLKINKRTLVRWTNREATRVETDVLKKLANVVGVSPNHLLRTETKSVSNTISTADVQVLENTLYAGGQFDVLLKAISNLRPESSDLAVPAYYRLLGMTHFRLGDIPSASKAMERAYRSIPKDSDVDLEARYFMNVVLMNRSLEKLPRILSTLKALEKRVKSTELKITIWHNLAISLIRLQRFAEAKIQQKRAYESIKDHREINQRLSAEVIFNYANLLFDLGEIDESLSLIEDGVQFTEEKGNLLVNASFLLLKSLVLTEKAAEEIQTLIERAEQNIDRVSANGKGSPLLSMAKGRLALINNDKDLSDQHFAETLAASQSDFEKVTYGRTIEKMRRPSS